MTLYKIVAVLWLFIGGAKALSYAKYLHDEEENVRGSVAVLIVVVLSAAFVYVME